MLVAILVFSLPFLVMCCLKGFELMHFLKTLPRFGQLLLWEWSPHRVGSLLLFETAPEYFLDVGHGESTHCWTWDTVERYSNAMSTCDFWISELNFWPLNWFNSTSEWSHFSPIHLRGKNTHHRGNPVDVDDVSDRLQNVKVKERLSWHWAVQPRLHERCPVLFQNSLWPTDVILTDAGHARIHNLRGTGV